VELELGCKGGRGKWTPNGRVEVSATIPLRLHAPDSWSSALISISSDVIIEYLDDHFSGYKLRLLPTPVPFPPDSNICIG